ncbi:MAG: hypothetical protein HS128_18430 [Ideonella sp.]|nr:hypothetical protein [Ideonella sp.]MCC7456715.1 hypothetical protein [Nitrospira sp.]
MTHFLRWLLHGVHRHDAASDVAESFEHVDSTALEAGAFRASGSMGLPQLAPARAHWSPLSGRAPRRPLRTRAAVRVRGGAAGT